MVGKRDENIHMLSLRDHVGEINTDLCVHSSNPASVQACYYFCITENTERKKMETMPLSLFYFSLGDHNQDLR